MLTRRRNQLLASVLAGMMIPTTSFGGVKVLPIGSVSILDGERVVRRIQSEMPVPKGHMMMCNGQCMVRSEGLLVVAREEAVFAVAEASRGVDVTLKMGQLDFALRASAPTLTFHTPHDTLRVEEMVVAATGDGVVRGSVQVTEKGTQLMMSEGTLRVATSGGLQVVSPGEPIQLALSELAAPGAAEGAAGGAAGAAGAAGGAAGAAGGAAGAAGAAAAGAGAAAAGALGMSTGGLVATGLAVAAIAAGAIAAANDDDDGDLSPSSPLH